MAGQAIGIIIDQFGAVRLSMALSTFWDQAMFFVTEGAVDLSVPAWGFCPGCIGLIMATAAGFSPGIWGKSNL